LLDRAIRNSIFIFGGTADNPPAFVFWANVLGLMCSQFAADGIANIDGIRRKFAMKPGAIRGFCTAKSFSLKFFCVVRSIGWCRCEWYA
jgi:hypothetical protein